MPLKTTHMKSIKQLFATFILLSIFNITSGQEIIPVEEKEKKVEYIPTTVNGKKRIDGIIAKVGDYIVLDSDIDLEYIEMRNQQVDIAGMTRCKVLNNIMIEKLYAHHAKLDTTIVVRDAEIESKMSQQVEYMLEHFGTMDKVVKYYNKKNEDEFRTFFFDILKTNAYTNEMRSKVTDEVTITPEEVRNFFVKIPKEDLPFFGSEVEVAQIIFEPKVEEVERQKVIDRLNEIRNNVLKGEVTFASQAVFYSQDPGSSSKGGMYKMTRKTPFVKEFKDVAFSLNEGEISKPFATDFGYHIIKLEKIRGQEYELRHILIKPIVSKAALDGAKEKANDVRKKIQAGEISFTDAAKLYSDEKETRTNGGLLINPQTQDTKFELTKMDPALYAQVSDLKEKEVSRVLLDEDKQGTKRYKLISPIHKIEPHTADYATDYVKIKDLALKEKQVSAIIKWVEDKVKETFISLNNEYRKCNFEYNWLNVQNN